MGDQSEAARVLEWFEGVDVYLIDQILKRRFAPGASILDAGCGGGRNVSYFLRAGYEVFGVDSSEAAIRSIRTEAERLAPKIRPHNFRVEPVEQMSFPDEHFGTVLSIAVLHFARDEAQFRAMLNEMWRVLRPGGLLFARLGSVIGIEKLVQPLGMRRFLVPDGSIRFLVDLEMLFSYTSQRGGELVEPIKTVNVQNMRCMTTWVVRKP